MIYKNRNKQQGAAIIVALFVTAIVATAAIVMMMRLQIDTRRTELILNDMHANFYAQGSVAWAIDQLNNDWQQQKQNQIIDKTPITSFVTEIKGVKIDNVIYDAQDKINLNNLSNSTDEVFFLRLLKTIGPKMNKEIGNKILLSLKDWISSSKNSEFEEYYLKSHPSYAAAHRSMVSVSELRLIKEMTPALFTQLLFFVTVLPEATKINVNNAPAEVLMSLSEGMTLDSANAILNYRKQNPFVTVSDFLNFDIVKNNPIPEAKITTVSNYFLLETHVTVGHQTIIIYTLLKRLSENTKSTVQVLWQSKGSV